MVSSNENSKIFFHTIGTAQSADQLVYEDKVHPKRTVGAYTTEDEKYLVIHTKIIRQYCAMVKDLTVPSAPMVSVIY